MQVEDRINRNKFLISEIIDNFNKIINSYDNLLEFEKNGCTYEQIRKELSNLKNSTQELVQIIPKLPKSNLLHTPNDFFKITYLPTLKIHLVYLSENRESKNDLLKIQARLAITYLNLDGCLDNLKIIRNNLEIKNLN